MFGILIVVFALSAVNAQSTNNEIANMQKLVQGFVNTFADVRLMNTDLIRKLNRNNPREQQIMRILRWNNQIATAVQRAVKTYPFVRHDEDKFSGLELVEAPFKDFVSHNLQAMDTLQVYIKELKRVIQAEINKPVPNEATLQQIAKLILDFGVALDTWAVLGQDRNQKVAQAVANHGNTVTPQATQIVIESVKLHNANIDQVGTAVSEINKKLSKL